MSSDATLGDVVKEALTYWDQLRANGATFEDCAASLETVIRARWPKGRVWRFLCETCDDTGLVMHTCPGDASCGRDKAHGPHTWGQPCLCAKGRRFDPKQKPSPDDFAQAGRVRKPTRIGR